MADWEGLIGAGQEDGHQLQLAPSLEGRPGGPAYQLSNSWVPCACPQAEARLPQVGGGALPSLSIRSASWLRWVGAPFPKKGGGA